MHSALSRLVQLSYILDGLSSEQEERMKFHILPFDQNWMDRSTCELPEQSSRFFDTKVPFI